MSFQIDYKDKNYSYELGRSDYAQNATRLLGCYKESHQYSDLKAIIVDLYFVAKHHPDFKKQACLSTQIFALTVFPTLNSNYEKFFVANSVCSIFVVAGLNQPKDWTKAQIKFGELIQAEGLDVEKARQAGITIMRQAPQNVARNNDPSMPGV